MVAKEGTVDGRFFDFKRAFRALTGHRYKFAMEGSMTTWWDLLSCNVLVQLIIKWAPRGGAKMTSCLRKCMSGSNWEVL